MFYYSIPGKKFYKCIECQEVFDSSDPFYYDEEAIENKMCIQCYAPIRHKRFIEWAEKELERLKSNETEFTTSKNDISLNYLLVMINSLNVKLNNFISETRKTLNALLQKYNLTDQESKSKLLNYENKKIDLYEALELYYSLDDSEFKNVMLEVYNLTHKNPIKTWNKKVKEWSNKYPDIVNRKINGIKNKLKNTHKDSQRSKESKDRYYSKQMISFRLPTIRKMLDSRGHLNVSDSSIEQALKAYYTMSNDEIMNDLIAHKNDNPDNDIQVEDLFEKKEITEFDLLGSYTSPSVMNTKDILNREA